jgi:flagellar basal-body rod protein FlgB
MALVDSTQQLLEAAMRGSWQRQTALTNNIANADTPGYVRQEVNFESALQGAMGAGEAVDQLQFSDEPAPAEAGPNGASVSVDQESARLAENGLDYQALTDVLNTRNNIMRSAIGIL